MHIKFGNQYLVCRELDCAPTTEGPSSMNNFFLYDESGSMYSSIKLLCEQMKAKIKELPLGDTLTLGWFSSEGGEYRFILKGHRLTSPKDYEAIDKIIDQNCTTRGTTCFSEIFKDLEQVIEEVEALNPLPNSLIFFTDGYPVVSDRKKEEENLLNYISKISHKIQSSLLVGYGDYYNKTLMATLADYLGGTLIHNDNLLAFSNRLTSFWSGSREMGPRIEVSLPTCSKVFSLGKDRVVSYDNTKSTLLISPLKEEKTYLYYVTDQPEGSLIDLTDELVKGSHPIVQGVYALAYLYSQTTQTDQALELLGSLGEVHLIDMLTNSYTNAEYGEAEASILESMNNPSQRFLKGRNTSYLPQEDAFCLKDVIDLLLQDKEAFFHTNDERFEYKRIGRVAATKEGYPKFQRNPAQKSDLSGLTYHDTRLNLSLRVKIDGHIPLDEQAPTLGLEKTYPTFIWRNYAIVKDGILNVPSLPLSLSKSSFDILQQKGCIDPNIKWKESGVYSVNFKALPIMNRKMAKGKTSALEMANLALDELKLEAALKVLKSYKTKYSEGGKLASLNLTAEQKTYLEKFGLTSNGFNPPSESLPATDFYEAKEFSIKLKGLSSLPKVEDVLAKMGAKQTKGGLLMEPMVKLCKEQEQAGKEDFLKWVEEEIIAKTKELGRVRDFIQGAKFAILLGKKWFDEFTSRDSGVITLTDSLVGNIEVSFSLGLTRVEF